MLRFVFRHSSRLLVTALALALLCHPAITQDDRTKSLFEQGTAAMRRNDASEAVRDFRAYLQSEPGSPEGYFNLGLALEMGGQLEEALSALQKAASLQPGLRAVRLFIGILDYKLNHLSTAHDELTRETRLEPKNAAGWMWLGVVELAQNKVDAAASDLDKASVLDPKNLDILYHRGRAHLLVSKESYAAMFKLAPDSWRVHEVLAQADAEAFRADDAISEFRLAIAGAPLEPGLHEELGDACWTAGKLQEADDAYAEEIKIDPSNAVALYKLGSLRVIRDDAANGVPLLERALTLDPALNDAHYYLGKGEGDLGKDDLAIEQFRLATNPQGAEELRIMSWYQLATIYRKLHRTQEAGQALATFRQLKAARDQRQESKFQEQGKRRDQLPRQETIPAESEPPPS
ncbi:MAG TPA: tetratricopeptide repeat protein [Candidatus Acidoferrum sp.]|nr:tetratricopeptide repeat protein [Candidatus Acidoferrum sp.]